MFHKYPDSLGKAVLHGLPVALIHILGSSLPHLYCSILQYCTLYGVSIYI